MDLQQWGLEIEEHDTYLLTYVLELNANRRMNAVLQKDLGEFFLILLTVVLFSL